MSCIYHHGNSFGSPVIIGDMICAWLNIDAMDQQGTRLWKGQSALLIDCLMAFIQYPWSIDKHGAERGLNGQNFSLGPFYRAL